MKTELCIATNHHGALCCVREATHYLSAADNNSGLSLFCCEKHAREDYRAHLFQLTPNETVRRIRDLVNITSLSSDKNQFMRGLMAILDQTKAGL